MNLTEHYKQILLREFLGPGVHADTVEGSKFNRGEEISQDQFEQIALQRSYRLAKLQKMGRKAATSVIKSIGDKKLLKMFRGTQIGIKEPPVWPDTEQGGRKTLSRIDAPNASNPAGSVQDVRKAIEIAKAIEAHPNGGIRHAHDFMRGFHTYHMSTPFADPGYHAGGDPFMTGEVKRRVKTDPNTGEVLKTRYVHNDRSEYPNADVAKGTIYYPYKPGTRPRPSGLAHFGPEWEGLHRSAEDLMKGRATEQTEEHYRKSLQMSRAYLNGLRERLDAHEGQ